MTPSRCSQLFDFQSRIVRTQNGHLPRTPQFRKAFTPTTERHENFTQCYGLHRHQRGNPKEYLECPYSHSVWAIDALIFANGRLLASRYGMSGRYENGINPPDLNVGRATQRFLLGALPLLCELVEANIGPLKLSFYENKDGGPLHPVKYGAALGAYNFEESMATGLRAMRRGVRYEVSLYAVSEGKDGKSPDTLHLAFRETRAKYLCHLCPLLPRDIATG